MLRRKHHHHRHAEALSFLKVCHEARTKQPERAERKCRNCMRDEGRPLEVGLQERASNRPKLLRSRAVVVSVGGKGAA